MSLKTFGTRNAGLMGWTGAAFVRLRFLLLRGGTTSVGLAAAAIATTRGVTVASTSRRPESAEALRAAGASQVFIDDGAIAADVRAKFGGGADKVLELIGTSTLLDSLRCAKEPGLVCMMGMVGNQWQLPNFSPMEAIPTGIALTTYDGGPGDFVNMPLQELLDEISAGTLQVKVGRVFQLDDIVEAHRYLETNGQFGKIVVTI